MGTWLRKVSGREQARINVQSSMFAELEQRYELTRDEVPQLQQLIGRFVSADELS